ncbi:MAG: amino acid permease [Candidatus Diapherotrites archaeon]|uniref:Amino acid permease n=2 Tax=Candidatus Iainarchaeum sp. TaxID=3101447 RepID=A0A8T4KUI1_9ARCH|nr:amino acid permease [Candidatus Diapherotrites archaeon]
MPFKEKLGLFDTTNLVIGAIVGADVYIATAFGLSQLGPASILAWIVAGIFAIITALAFSQCARHVQKSGGPYAFVKQAFGNFPGFVSGWLVWLAELASMCVFPLAFVAYLNFLVPIDFFSKTILIALFLAFLFLTNYFGIKKAAQVNDVLTIIKLLPLLLIILLGFWVFASNPSQSLQNFSPFSPFGFESFGEIIVLVFWAFVGFELATIPAGEIKNPRKTIPKAIIIGVSIVAFFYIITNISLIAIAGMQLAGHDAPLALAASLSLGAIGALIMVVGAMLSVSGSDESNIIGTSRLGFALSADGYFPKFLSRLHPKYSSPVASLAFHSIAAFALTLFFLLVTLSAFRLNKRKTRLEKAILAASLLVCAYIIINVQLLSVIVGIAALLFGIVVYPFFSKQELKAEKAFLLKEEHIAYRMIRHEESFLANVFKHLKIQSRKLQGLKHAHSLRERAHSHKHEKASKL